MLHVLLHLTTFSVFHHQIRNGMVVRIVQYIFNAPNG